MKKSWIGLVLLGLALPGWAAKDDDVLEVTGLVISISFKDTKPEYIHPLKDIYDFFNDPDYRNNPSNVAKNNGSLWNYYYEVSNGKFSLKHEVAHYEAPNTAEYYLHKSEGGKGVRELLDLAIRHLRDEQKFDFSKLTLNGDNEIVELAIFYVCNAVPRDDDFIPGYAAGNKKDYGDFKTRRFHIVPQRNFYKLPDGTRPLVLRTFAHEAGHAIFGWPDLYDVDGSSRGLGMANLMSGTGDYPNPLMPCSYLRAKEGWIPTVDITNDRPGTVHKVPGDGELVYRYNHPVNTNEYFLIDALYKKSRKDGRFNTARNKNVPPEGLRIWHVEEKGVNSREAMTPTSHYKMSMEQADGKFDLEKGRNGGDTGDTFYKGHVTKFDDTTTPNANWWDGSKSGLRIVNVSSIGPTMTFKTAHIKSPVYVDNARPFQIRQTQGYLDFPVSSYKLTNILPSKRLSWVVKTDVNWLELSRKSGQLKPGENVTVTAEVTAEAMKKLSGKTGSATANIAIAIPAAKTVFRRKIDVTVEPPMLIHHWKFDEKNGTVAEDSVGGEETAMSFNKQFLRRYKTDGMFDGGVRVGKRGELNADLGGRACGTITLCGWVKIPAMKTGVNQSLLYFQNENAGLTIDREGNIRYAWGRGRGGMARMTIKPDEWTFVALTVEPKGAVITVHQPGSEPQRKEFKRGKHKPLELTRFYVGGTSRKNCLVGAVDDVRIYNYPLSEKELRKLAEEK